LERLRFFLVLLALSLGPAGLLTACTPSIGDKCNLSTDCSLNGTVLCDTSQPNGYCTVFNCTGNDCRPSSTCVLFNAAIQGCPYTDRTPSRTSRSFCMAPCNHDSDCRTNDGYICADPRQAPWNALILDNIQSQLVCIQKPGGMVLASLPNPADAAAVCEPSGPPITPIDASVTPMAEAGAPDAGAQDAGAQDGGPQDAGPQDAADSGG
jgi:hypothetical protein